MISVLALANASATSGLNESRSPQMKLGASYSSLVFSTRLLAELNQRLLACTLSPHQKLDLHHHLHKLPG